MRRGVGVLAGSRVGKNLVAVTSSSVLSNVISLATVGYAARVLGPTLYGMAGYAMSVSAYASILVLPGLSNWGSRAIAASGQVDDETVSFVLVTRLALACVAYLFLAAFATVFLQSRDERLAVLMAGSAIIVAAVNVDWILVGLQKMRTTALGSILAASGKVFVLFTFVRKPTDVHAYLIMPQLVLAVVALVMAVLLKRHGIKLHFPTRRLIVSNGKKALYLSATVTLAVVLHHFNNISVHTFLGAKELGLFLAAFSLFGLFATVPTLLGSVLAPFFTRTVSENPNKARLYAREYARIHLLCGFFFAAIVLTYSDQIIRVIYGAAFVASVPLFRIMSLGIVFNFAICGYTNVLMPFGYDKAFFRAVLVTACWAVIGGLTLVPSFGLLGAAWSVSLIDAAGWSFSVPSYTRAIGIVHWQDWLRPFLALATLWVVGLVLDSWGVSIFLAAPVGLAAFIAVVRRDAVDVVTSIVRISRSAEAR